MSPNPARRPHARLLAASAALALLPVPLMGAASAPSTAASAAVSTADCVVVDGTLTWGFKESFRSYISGSIANGAWEPFDGATYETPDFGWSGATGAFDPETLTGEATFPGGVRFTGHDGLLDTTVANPTLSIQDGGSGTLLLDLVNLSMDDALAGNTENVQELTQVPFVSLDLAASPLAVSEDGATVTGTAVPTVITAEGYEGMGTYETGEAFDPLTFALTVECTEPEPEPTATVEADEPTPEAAPTAEPAADDDDAGWLWPALIGGTFALAGLVALVVWAVRRRRPESPSGDADTPRDGAA